MKKIAAVMLGLVMMMGALAGCAPKSESTGSAVSAGSDASQNAAAPVTNGKFRTLEEIKASGQIVMLTNAEFSPYEYIYNGDIAGVDVDLAQKIADELGVKLVIENMDFNLLVDALKSGKGDFVAAGMTATPERAKSVAFSTPYVLNGLLIIVKEGSDIKTPADLEGKLIAVQEGTTADIMVTDEVAAKDVLRFKAITEAGNAVANNKADAAVMDIIPAQGIVANSNGALVLLDEQLTEEDMSMAVALGNQELLDVINGVLDAAMADGTIESLIEKHTEQAKS